jgi:pyridoxal phosphate enzyme (YggS family)
MSRGSRENCSTNERLALVRQRLAAAARGAGRDPKAVSLVAVSKTKTADEIRPVLDAGQRLFGENRLLEAAEKWPALRRDYAGINLHLIGPLQTNKAAAAVALFDAIETLDREKLARLLAVEMARQNKRPTCFIQVNTGAEPQKAGIAPGAADSFIALCRGELDLPVVGVMCIPPVDDDPRPHFGLLAEIARRNGLGALSMGMSNDFEIAIREGATHVRVGSAIFGERPAPAGR